MAMKHISEFLKPAEEYMAKHDYRFKFQIVDTVDDTVMIGGSTYVSSIDDNGGCESIELELFSALRAFKKKLERIQEVEDDAKRMTENND